MKPVFKCCLFFLLFAFIFVLYARPILVRRQELLDKTEAKKPVLLKSILDASTQPDGDGKNIFFIESHKNENKTLSLTPRQACSIESAAFTNPDKKVFVLFAYEVEDSNSSDLIQALRSYQNVHIHRLDILRFSEKSPLEEWFKSGKIFNSQYIIQHESDILRILTLWKYSGTYFDLDVILKQHVNETNFACIQSDGLINSAIVNLDKEIGRTIAERNFQEVINHFNGESWTGNGPTVLSDIVKIMCNTTDQSLMSREKCQGFKVLPVEQCYAIGYGSWQKFFDENSSNEVTEATKHSFAVHFWNYLSGGTKLPISSRAPYIEIARDFCPRVLSTCVKEF